jgi:hypothetical protein
VSEIEGTLSVSVANGVQVVRHNAESEPVFLACFPEVGSHEIEARTIFA